MKASVYYLNHPTLLLNRHLIIARQTQSPSKDIRADVNAGTGDISVAAAPAIPLHRHERIYPVDRLHVHGFPDGAAFGVESGDGVQDFLGAALAADALVQVILLSAHHGRHGVFVDDHARARSWERSFPDPRDSS